MEPHFHPKPSYMCHAVLGGTTELCSVVTVQRSWWGPGPPVDSSSMNGQNLGPGWGLSPQLEMMALHDNFSRILSPHSALASV